MLLILSLSMLAAVAGSDGQSANGEIEKIKLQRLGLNCGTVAGVEYCYPAKLLWGSTPPGERFDDQAFTLDAMLPEDQYIDCFGVFGDKHEFLISPAPKDDNIHDRATRVRDNKINQYLLPLRSTIWNGLDCNRSNYPRGWICIVDGKLTEKGMTIIGCDGEGTVPVPICTQTYYTHGLEVITHYRQQCGVHWQAITKLAEDLLEAGAVAAAQLRKR